MRPSYQTLDRASVFPSYPNDEQQQFFGRKADVASLKTKLYLGRIILREGRTFDRPSVCPSYQTLNRASVCSSYPNDDQQQFFRRKADVASLKTKLYLGRIILRQGRTLDRPSVCPSYPNDEQQQFFGRKADVASLKTKLSLK